MADRALAEGKDEAARRAPLATTPEPSPARGAGQLASEELRQARERIAFYEGFDRLIQENIARSGDLLRQAAERRETAIQEVRQVRAESERRRAGQQATLTLLAEEMLALQQRVGELTRRIMLALDDLDAPVTSDPALPDPLPASLLSVTGTVHTAVPTEPDAAIAETSETPRPATPAAPATDAALREDEEGARPISVVVHGLPRAAAALALQRHLAGLATVEAVEAREFAAGVLRLEVLAHGPLSLDDLRGWDGGADLQPMHVLPSVIEVTLPASNE